MPNERGRRRWLTASELHHVVCKVVKLALLLAVGAIACDRGRSNPPSPTPSLDPPAPAAPQPKPTSCTLSPVALRYPMPKRLVAIGDLHGDLAGMRSALVAAGAIDDKDTWIGGDLMIVQTGDVLDRGDDEQSLLDQFERLEREAAAAGGRFVWLLGNHELMNAAGDLRYVTAGGFRDFEDVKGLPLDRYADVPEPARARVAALAPGGPYAQVLAGQHLAVVVGDTVFVHGGIRPDQVADLPADLARARCWLAGQGDPPHGLTDSDGPVWDRSFAMGDGDCAALDESLRALGVARMVVGHTVQPRGITSACDGKVWRIDVGLARHYGGPSQALELGPDGPRVLGAAK